MLSGMQLIIHDGPLFRWVAKDYGVQFIDMLTSGILAAAIARKSGEGLR